MAWGDVLNKWLHDREYKASNGKIYIIHCDPYGSYSVVNPSEDIDYNAFYGGCESYEKCINELEKQISSDAADAKRIAELKKAFEESGRKQNFAEPAEVDTLISLTEKKIIRRCRRPQCHGCKLGWICPKFWA